MSNAIAPVSGPQGVSQPTHDPRTEKLRHAATEFESILVKQLLKAAKMGGAGGGEKANGYADMAVDALASSIESGGGLGLARRIEEAIGASAHVSHAATPGAGEPPSGEGGA
jgi:Rod binding domain-containing protein